jgi:hypothetical protein
MKRVLSSFLLLGLWGSALAAAEQEPGSPDGYVIEARRIETPPVIDGDLSDPVWQQGFLIKDFIQIEPDAGQPATERTEARIAYDAHYIYFGVRCFDTDASKIVAPSVQRDSDLTYDDSIQVTIDTFHDRSNAFFFAVNPSGAQIDGQVRHEGEDISLEWDGLWSAVTRRDGLGWTAEIAIPFKTLRFPSAEPQTWGFNMRRFVTRKNEESFWKPLKPAYVNFGRYKISDFGVIAGLTGMTSAGRFQAIPYVLARHRKDARGETTTGDAGGDLKVILNSNLTADVTVHTDFAEAEADLQQINLTPYKLQYPEKRQFFLEGSNLFFFGDRGANYFDPDAFQLFFSRQIGLTADGNQAIPILGGAKVTGNLDSGLSVGFLNMTTEPLHYVDSQGFHAFAPQTNYTVMRLRQSLGDGDRRTIGVIALNKDSAGPAYNRAGGLDWQYALTEHLSSAGFVSKTETPDLRGKDYAGSVDLLYQSQVIQARTSYTDIGDNFNPEMGFTTRIGARKLQGELVGYFNPDFASVHHMSVINDFNHVVDQSGRLESQVWLRELTFATVHRSGFALLSYDTLQVLTLPLVLSKGVAIPPGTYRFTNYFLGAATDHSLPLAATVHIDDGDFYDGTRFKTLLSVDYRPLRGLVTAWTWDHTRVKSPHGNFTTDLYYSDVTYSPNRDILIRSLLQWNRLDNFRANVSLGWTYRPGSTLFLVYNDAQDLDQERRDAGFSPVIPGRSFVLKASRRFDF